MGGEAGVASLAQSRSYLAACAVFTLLVAILAAAEVKRSYDSEMARATQTAEGLAAVLAEQVSGALREVVLVLRAMRDTVTIADIADPEGVPAPIRGDIDRYLAERLRDVPQAGDLMLVDQSGRVVYAARAQHGADFTAPGLQWRSVASGKSLALSGPAISPTTREPGLVMAVGLDPFGGPAQGLAVAEIKAQAFTHVFANVGIGKGGTVVLRDGRWRLIAGRLPDDAFGSKPGNDPVAARVGLGETIGSQVTSTGLVSGQVHAFRKVGEFPFTVVVSLDQADFLGDWLSKLQLYLIGAVLLVLLAVALSIGFLRERRLSAALSESEGRLSRIVESAPFPLVLASLDDRRIILANDAFALLFGLDRRRLQNLMPEALHVSPESREEMFSRLSAGREVAAQEYEMRRADGAIFTALVSGTRIHIGDEPAALIAVNDISDRKRLENELRRRATTDMLTGIANRAHFIEQAEREFARARRYGRPMAVLLLDVDHFKQVNDRHGHRVGDEALKSIAYHLMATLRLTDIAGRHGGEEFAALLPETDEDGALIVAERLRRRIAESPVTPEEGLVITLSVSIGVATLLPDDPDLDAAIARADIALYAAKNHGRNRVEMARGPTSTPAN
jgi:diguanylate cyclase (GGDEF)-like protein/PAS domain S-box-containing protein